METNALFQIVTDKICNLPGTKENSYISHIIISDHGAGTEYIQEDKIIATEIKPIFIPNGWNKDNLFKLENWLKETLSNPTIIKADNIKISTFGTWYDKFKKLSFNLPTQFYNDSLATLTDAYQISMAYAYWKANRHEQHAVFHLFFRKNPFEGDFAIAAGLEYVVNFLINFKFKNDDIEYLATLCDKDNKPLFEKDFLSYLRIMKFSCSVNAIPEGTVVFPNEPLLQVSGPIIQCQLLETALLNIINFQTLIATKATRICLAAKDDPVIEFGLRRAQGIDGGVSASRAAYIGGCVSTSNVLAGKMFGIPVTGTHAHSWVMSFDSEIEAFEAYAEAMPTNCTLLVDTYDTLNGVKNAIKIGLLLRSKGYDLNGIRLDSGNLAELSYKARIMLDEAGFEKTQIVASNDLDEDKIVELKRRGAKINVWGVGTALVTGDGQPALGGVYKLGSLDGVAKIKLSEDSIKTTNPGILRTIRYMNSSGLFVCDMISDENWNVSNKAIICNNIEYSLLDWTPVRLDVPIFKNGVLVAKNESLQTIRNRRVTQINSFNHWISKYPIGIDKQLHTYKLNMIKDMECKYEFKK